MKLGKVIRNLRLRRLLDMWGCQRVSLMTLKTRFRPSGLVSQLPKLEPKTAVILSKFAPAETSDLVRRLRELDARTREDDGAVTPV
jgi:hypothetical protein